MKKSRLLGAVCACVLVLATTTSNAALITRLGGQAVYDDDLDITWLADANYAMTSGFDSDGLMVWNNAISWIRTFQFGGYDNWRLPETSTSTYCAGFGCVDGEMGHLYWIEFWNGSGLSVTETSKFKNIQLDGYWYQTSSGTLARTFFFNNGAQGNIGTGSQLFVWPVADGDIFASTIPLPAAVWLFGSGLLGLVGIARKKA
jgi:hypothetical protein